MINTPIKEHPMHSLKKGFSLIELLVVIAIIGILAAVGTTAYQVYIESSKQAVIKNNAASLLQALSVEDLAQSATTGGYPGCTEKTNVASCVESIFLASTISNPYNQNARYGVAGIPDTPDNTELTRVLSTANRIIVTNTNLGNESACEEGNVSIITEIIQGSLFVSTRVCTNGLMVEYTQPGKRKMFYFTANGFAGG